MSLLWRTATAEYSYGHEPNPEGLGIYATHVPTGERVGSMWLSHPRGPNDLSRTVSSVGVHEEHRRRGVASGMLDHARSLGLDVKHSHPSARTPDGEAWTRAMEKRRPSTNVHDSSDYSGGSGGDSGGSGSLS